MSGQERETLRAEFEALHNHFYGYRPFCDDEIGNYAPALVRVRWEFFQAARAAQPAAVAVADIWFEISNAFREGLNGAKHADVATAVHRMRVAYQDAIEQLQPAAPARPANCSNALREAGKSYPRTCASCGLGPCKGGA
jgi:hypothetical protein